MQTGAALWVSDRHGEKGGDIPSTQQVKKDSQSATTSAFSFQRAEEKTA